MRMRASDCVPHANGQHRRISPVAPFRMQRHRHTHKRIHVNTLFCICYHDTRNEHGGKGHWHVRERSGDRMNKYTEFRIDVGVATGGLGSRWRAKLLKRAGQEPNMP